ncbi:multicopper oxidase domain-containing protein [Halorussus salinisoli]|uniref:multicopper oxidase domain-containing protein n=1 Tax=Halorussus salinisoli TaxID=2558242 RepID=UPI0010C1F04F
MFGKRRTDSGRRISTVTPRPTVSAPADTSTTVTVAPGTIQTAQNSSARNWLFHCHNLYYPEAGMARVVRYAE